MFLKAPKASTDPRLRSLLQKAVRRGFSRVVDRAVVRLDASGDDRWLRSRTVVITFEECWPLAGSLCIDRELSSRRVALLNVTKAAKQKDAAGLGALAYAYHEGDTSMLDCVPDERMLRMVSEALERPKASFEWALGESRSQRARKIIHAARQYLPAATWPWDKACILAAALLASRSEIPRIESADTTAEHFPYWVALDKHTAEGKLALREVAKLLETTYRRLIWASFYYESARVNRLLSSPWFDAERFWRLRRAGLSLESAKELWSRAQPLVRQHLEAEALSLKELVEGMPLQRVVATQNRLL
jgi:hypothetical protein